MSNAQPVTWTETVGAIGAIATPLVVVALGLVVNTRLKHVEEQQWRGRALTEARLRYYGDLAGELNDLLCFFTFIGTWKEHTPVDVVAMKRRLDRSFAMHRPFFSEATADAYSNFMDCCFETFGDWGADARLRTGYGRRREALGKEWDDNWNSRFLLESGTEISPEGLLDCRQRYLTLVERFVEDIEIAAPRTDYVTSKVSLNAH